jgi:hypothetical protein
MLRICQVQIQILPHLTMSASNHKTTQNWIYLQFRSFNDLGTSWRTNHLMYLTFNHSYNQISLQRLRKMWWCQRKFKQSSKSIPTLQRILNFPVNNVQRLTWANQESDLITIKSTPISKFLELTSSKISILNFLKMKLFNEVFSKLSKWKRIAKGLKYQSITMNHSSYE